MNKKAFTLIEVLVSIVILSTVAVLLFEISSNSKNNFSYLQEKARFTILASLPIMQNNKKYHNSDKTLYEFIRYDFDIKDDELRKYLKNIKIHYTQEEFSTFSPFSEEEGMDMAQTLDKDEQMMNFTIVFDKISINHEEQSTFIYKIDIK